MECEFDPYLAAEDEWICVKWSFKKTHKVPRETLVDTMELKPGDSVVVHWASGKRKFWMPLWPPYESLAGLYAEIFPRGAKFGERTKEGGGSLCEVLHPRGGARMTQGGGGGGQIPLPPFNTALTGMLLSGVQYLII